MRLRPHPCVSVATMHRLRHMYRKTRGAARIPRAWLKGCVVDHSFPLVFHGAMVTGHGIRCCVLMDGPEMSYRIGWLDMPLDTYLNLPVTMVHDDNDEADAEGVPQ